MESDTAGKDAKGKLTTAIQMNAKEFYNQVAEWVHYRRLLDTADEKERKKISLIVELIEQTLYDEVDRVEEYLREHPERR